MRKKPRDVSDELWEWIEPLLPARQRRFRDLYWNPLDDWLVELGRLWVATPDADGVKCIMQYPTS